MRAVALIISLSLVVCCALAANPCDTTLDAIQSAMASANIHRQACEKSFFSASACDSYWTAVNQILTMQINYQDCGRKTQDKFYSDVKTNVATEGTNTRTSVSTNAQTTQNTVNTQHTTTRSHVTAEATRTVSQVNAETDSQNDQTRRLVSDESTNTRTLISNEHAKTNTFIDNNTTTILSTTVTQATTTRQEVDAQHAQTRSTLTQVIQTEGVDTRTNTDQEAETTRTLIKAEAKATRDTVEADGVATRDYVASQAEKTRTNTTNEASATRTTVTNQHGQTRAAVNAARDDVKSTVSTTATATQNTVTTQGSATRKQVSDEAANTNQVITNAFNANTASLNTLQSTQNNFTSLFIQLFIMMDFSSSGARVDLFQRPASQGGYFETMRAVVRNVIDTNKSLYSWTSYKIGAAETYWAAGEGYYGQSKPDYRRAWEAYRAAYLYATNSN